MLGEVDDVDLHIRFLLYGLHLPHVWNTLLQGERLRYGSWRRLCHFVVDVLGLLCQCGEKHGSTSTR